MEYGGLGNPGMKHLKWGSSHLCITRMHHSDLDKVLALLKEQGLVLLSRGDGTWVAAALGWEGCKVSTASIPAICLGLLKVKAF